MKKSNIINLIRYHSEKNESGFRSEAYEIAREFDRAGDTQIAAYIMSLLSTADSMIPQSIESESPFLDKVAVETDMLLLPDSVKRDILGIVNAVNHRIGINKFLFEGPPGTGKTEAVKHLARILMFRGCCTVCCAKDEKKCCQDCCRTAIYCCDILNANNEQVYVIYLIKCCLSCIPDDWFSHFIFEIRDLVGNVVGTIDAKRNCCNFYGMCGNNFTYNIFFPPDATPELKLTIINGVIASDLFRI